MDRDSYWLNLYHYTEENLTHDDAHITYYRSFIRRGLEKISNDNNNKCFMSLVKILQVHTFSHADVLQVFFVVTNIWFILINIFPLNETAKLNLETAQSPKLRGGRPFTRVTIAYLTFARNYLNQKFNYL
jgi:hypothetical protein